MDKEKSAILQLEYSSAQEMLRHYDTLNWQIGSVLVAAMVVLTGLALNKDFLEIIRQTGPFGLIVTFIVPAFSCFVLGIWLLWFRRHRAYYNLRNETLHRVEIELGMYHFLRVVEADGGFAEKGSEGKVAAETLARAKKITGSFEPLYKLDKLPRPSGATLAVLLTFGVPFCQLLIFVVIRCEGIYR